MYARKISPRAVGAFFVTLALCWSLVGFTVFNRSNLERITMEQLIVEKSVKISDVISRLVYKTQALAALVIQHNGQVENFEKVAEAIIDDPAILNVLIAPDGVVSNVYPLKGNELLVGFNLFSDGQAPEDSVLARESRQLIFGGPFNIIQGGQALIGRLPVWFNTPNGPKFWGLVNVTLKYPDVLDGVGMGDIESRGLCYEIWRIDMETRQKQVIARSKNGYNENMRFIEKPIRFLNADWYFRIAPINNWYEYPETWILAVIGLCISLLMGFITQSNYKLNLVKAELETKAEALSRSNDAKTSFLANMSHEIRTPMNGIIGFSELALDDKLPRVTKDYLGKIRQSATGLLGIINNILDISKVESGKMELEKIPFCIKEVFKICETISSPTAIEKGIDLYSKVDGRITEKLLGDPTKLRQVLLNLLSNALKFTESGTVEFSATIREEGEHSLTVYFEVCDSGIGMSAAEIKRVFEPFTQGDSSTTRKYGGTGLGLTIAKNMIELMGGQLKVESVLGEGSKFGFVLTLEIARALAETTCKEKQINTARRPVFRGNVLVCEDNVINQQVIKAHLDRVGLNAVIAQNGQIGLDMAIIHMMNGKAFDLILMDVHMPVMDGLEAAKKLAKIGNKTPVIAMTANIMFKNQETYRAQGMSDCLDKPFKAQDLWACLLKYLQPVGFANVAGDVEDDYSTGDVEDDYNAGDVEDDYSTGDVEDDYSTGDVEDDYNAGNVEDDYSAGGVEDDYSAGGVKDDYNAGDALIDRQRGVEQTADSEELYERLLVKFAHDGKNVFTRLSEAVNEGNIKLAHRIAHSLKSSSGMLGASRLSSAAYFIESSLAEGKIQAAQAQMPTLAAEMDALMDELVPLLAAGEKECVLEGMEDKKSALALAGRLEPLIKAGNFECLELLPEIRKVLLPIGDKGNKLAAQIEKYDFELALETLLEIKKEIQKTL